MGILKVGKVVETVELLKVVDVVEELEVVEDVEVQVGMVGEEAVKVAEVVEVVISTYCMGGGLGHRLYLAGWANDCQPEVQIVTLNELNSATTSNFHKKGTRKSLSVLFYVFVVVLADVVVVVAACIY